MLEYKHYLEANSILREKLNGFTPNFLLILGSGLGFLGEQVKNSIIIDYKDVPHMQISTAPDHIGRFIFGTLGNAKVMIMQGRLHYYEGYEPEELTFPVRLAHLLGVQTMILTNAVGGINTDYKAGELVLIKDIIKFACPNPLRGKNIDEFGPRFPDMVDIFTPELRQVAMQSAKELNIKLHEGVYQYAQGPQFETPAEIRAYRTLGADVVGMSTAPEAIVASHCKMRIMGISLVSNMASGVLKSPITVEEINSYCSLAQEPFAKLILSILDKIK
ncbi:MAG: purine-nucleoside phosphorylase [Filifactoraceae bacterium]